MDRFDKVIQSCHQALQRLREGVLKRQQNRKNTDYSFYRDAVIQCFEFTFEIVWKTLKLFLEREGIQCRSPRSCIRECFNAGYLSEEEVRALFQMVEMRNLTVHTYYEELAETLADQIADVAEILTNICMKVERYAK